MKTVFRLFLVMVLLFAGTALWAGPSDSDTDDTDVDVAMAAGMYREAPMLAAMVASGDLPAVDERLPDEPLVWEWIPEVGKYGGTLTTYSPNINSWGDLSDAPDYSEMVKVLADGSVIGDIADDWEFSADGKTLTMHIREGLKWSDGVPVTAEDIRFTRDDMHSHELLGSWGATSLSAESVSIIDDNTFQLDYLETNEATILTFTGYAASEWGMIMPSHHYKPWHIDYNDDANDIAVEKGFESWNDLIMWSHPIAGVQKDLERPTLFPFYMDTTGNDVKSFVRNPYFHGVDRAGNQLPYVDRMVVQIVDPETYHLKVAAGEMDLGYYDTTLENYTLYKENEASGGYKVSLIPGLLMSEVAISFNAIHPDPVKGAVIGDPRFRYALSAAIDRDEINEILYQGVAEPRQLVPYSTGSFYKAQWEDWYVDFDPTTANRLLDQMGMSKRGSDGFRLAPGGQAFQLILEHNLPDDKMLVLVEEYWEAVGINLTVVFEERTLWRARRQDNVWDVIAGGSNPFNEPKEWAVAGNGPPVSVLTFQPWSNYMDAWINIEVKGTATLEEDYEGVWPGVKPPEWVFRAYEFSRIKGNSAYGSAQYIKAAQDLVDIRLEQLWDIGTVGRAPTVVIARSNLGNVPTQYYPMDEYPGSLNRQVVTVYYK